MFTSVDSSVRKITPKNVDGRTVVKVVYVVLESQYQSSLSDAVRSINVRNPHLCVEVTGYLLEELRDKKNYEDFVADVGSANVFIGSLIFIEELADKILPVLEENRDRLDAALVFPSMPKLMRQNKLGAFELSQLGQSKSAIAEMMRSARKKDTASFEETMLKLVRTLPQVLKYLPSDKAADARNFLFSLQYWLGGSAENLENFLTRISLEYVPELAGVEMDIPEPVTFPDLGV